MPPGIIAQRTYFLLTGGPKVAHAFCKMVGLTVGLTVGFTVGDTFGPADGLAVGKLSSG